MKTKFLLPLLTLLTLILAAQAQSLQGCGMHIIPNPESDCLIEDYLERYPNMVEPGAGDCLLACGGATVTYTAVCPGAVRYSWNISGADTALASGHTARVIWGNEETGHISVTAVLADSTLCTAEACILLIEPPRVAFTSVPAWHYDSTGKKIIEVCLGQTLELHDRSEAGRTPITGYYWESCFGSSSTQDFTASNYSGNSEYPITHCVTNECGCQDCEEITLRVLDSASLRLSCHGTVCQNSSASYSLLEPDCDGYFWNIEGGTLEGQGTPDITVHWGAPPSGFGVISLDTRTCDVGCASLHSIRIPIIVDNAEIQGPDTACVGEIQQFELPFWGSTQYLWNTVSDSASGFLERSADFPNKYLVEFTHPGTYTIGAEYACGFLQCGPFQTQKAVVVRDTLSIASPDNVVCVSGTGRYTTRLGEPLAWQVFDRDNTLLLSAHTDTLVCTFPVAGAYRVTAYGPAYCRKAVFHVSVPENPPPVSSVQGPDEACPNSSIPLSATPSPGCYLQWQPLCPSATPHSVEGDKVTINYRNEVCPVAVFQVDGLHGCRSQAHIHNVDSFVLAPIEAPPVIHLCAGAEITLPVADQSHLVTYEWKVEPAFAASVQGDHLKPSVQVLTNRLYSPPEPNIAYVTLERKYCTSLKTVDTVILFIDSASAVPTVTYPDTLCEGGCGSFTAIGATPDRSHYTWDFGGGYAVTARDTSLCFSTPGAFPFTLTYLPVPNCVPASVDGQVTVVGKPASTLTVSGDTLLCVPQQTGVTYAWEFNGQETGLCQGSPCCIMAETGKYCCTVRDSLSPHCESRSCHDNTPGGHGGPDSCITLYPTVTQNSCTEFVIEASGLPAGRTVTWDAPEQSRFEPLSGNSAVFSFYVPGTFTVYARAEVSGLCYRGRTEVVVDCIPRIDLRYDCDGHLVVRDTSLYRTGMNAPIRVVSIEGTGFVSQIPIGESATEEMDISSLERGDYRVTMDFDMDGVPCSVSAVFKWLGNPAVTNIDIRRKMCKGGPFPFYADTDGDIARYRWDFGDGSYNFGDTIYHTYSATLDQNTVIVTLSVTDVWGCTASDTAHVEVGEEVIKGKLKPVDSVLICPGQCRVIQYKTEDDLPLSVPVHYTWRPGAIPSNESSTCVYQTGDYTVWVETDNYGCRYSSICNVGFLNVPTARITGSTMYCEGETVALNGNSGASNQYSWSVAPEGIAFSTPNIRFVPSLTGIQTASLTVTGPEGCTASAAGTFTVHPKPPTPSIAVSPLHSCLHEPPVDVVCPSGLQLNWSNGRHGYGAGYYTPGHLSAHYYDPLTGCRSESAYAYIDPAPDYEALLTGCYRLCPDSIGARLPVYGFYPCHSPSLRWWWSLDGNDIDSGSVLSPLLPLPEFGTYILKTRYGSGCEVSSPPLEIGKAEYCPCPDIGLKPGVTECFVEDCRMLGRFAYTVLNQGGDTVTFDDLQVLAGGSLVSVTGLPLSLPPGTSGQLEIVVELTDFASAAIEFILIDNERGCETRRSETLPLEDCLEHGCKLDDIAFHFLPDRSTPHQTAWFQVDFSVFGAADVIALWSEPSQVVGFSVVSPALGVEGLVMLDYGLLTQWAAEDRNVCLYALICLDADRLCIARRNIKAYNLLQEVLQN